ncbi:MAG: beta-ketoacyl synthase N-terminal-like domain-containing protein [Myxococcota bacterium]
MSRDRRAPIAIIGLSGRFPGASGVDRFWANLAAGHEAITRIPEAMVDARRDAKGSLPANFVPMGAHLDGTEWFDHDHFGLSNRDAKLMDPQQRLFVEHAWTAVEDAGHDPATLGRRVAVYAGGGPSRHVLDALDHFGHDGGTLFEVVATGVTHAMAMRVSHLFGFTGESVYLYTACSTSLVAVDLACRALEDGRADVAIAGGTALWLPQGEGWDYIEGMILSKDGHCRPFDADATGTVWGNGVGVVVLKPLDAALRDGDPIRAVVVGSFHNNDGGADKHSFASPSATGQADAIASAYRECGVDPASVTFVEAHGTGTVVGDPLEVDSLHRVFGRGRGPGTVALGSVKGNIGHLDPAAGVASLVKTVLALEHRQIPPTVHFRRPNPRIDFDGGPFHVPTALTPWEPAPGAPRRAGINSFGVGGANCHLIVEEAPPTESGSSPRPVQPVILSARTPAALDRMAAELADHLEAHPGLALADVAYTRALGRRAWPIRAAVVAEDGPSAVRRLRAGVEGHRAEPNATPVFLFPGQGSQAVGMAHELYAAEPSFRDDLDDCAALLYDALGVDLRDLLFPPDGDAAAAEAALTRTEIAQPALFAVCFALARLWNRFGVIGSAAMGHSVGEYVAACLAGVFSPADAFRLLVERGRAMGAMPEGAMLAVSLGERHAGELLVDGLALAAINGPEQCVVCGPRAAVDAAARTLAAAGVPTTPLRTSHAFHHPALMAEAAEAFRAVVRGVELHPPSTPVVSNVTGTWLTDGQATDPDYWATHLRSPVRWADGLRTLRQGGHRLFLEVGPGRVLSGLFAADRARPEGEVCLPSLPHRRSGGDHATFFGSLAGAWSRGASVDWAAVFAAESRRRVRLPPYPFEKAWCALYAPGEEYRLVEKALGAQRLGYGPEGARPAEPAAAPHAGALPGVVAERPASLGPFVAPTSDVETLLCELFGRALGLRALGVDDDLWDLGAQSLMVVGITNHLRAELDVNVTPAQVFENTTVRALARVVDAMRAPRGS